MGLAGFGVYFLLWEGTQQTEDTFKVQVHDKSCVFSGNAKCFSGGYSNRFPEMSHVYINKCTSYSR